jgi:chemotaxis protein CheZ
MRQQVSQRIEELRSERGNMVPIEEIGEIVDAILKSMNGDLSGTDLKLYSEIESLAAYIDSARAEIAAIRPQDIRDEHIQVVTDELDAIVSHTEEATGAILDAAEKLEAIAGTVDGAAAEGIRDAVTSVYEACNFQDITGQRITRVVRALKDIESKVAAIVETFSDTPKSAGKDKTSSPASGKPSDAELLNGPQLPDAAQSQADIDALFASLK